MKTNKIKSTIYLPLICLLSISIFQSCSILSDRTTTIYGMVTDDKGLPVDSMEIVVEGSLKNRRQHMATAYSDSSGHYEVLVDVAGKFNAIHCLIPAYAIHPKFTGRIATYEVYSEGKKRRCCRVEIGEKTNLDFQLKSK